jgi:hypothetical protein
VGSSDAVGGRLVCIHGVPVCRAYGLRDMIRLRRRAGLDLGEENDIAISPRIGWAGPGPLG